VIKPFRREPPGLDRVIISAQAPFNCRIEEPLFALAVQVSWTSTIST